MKQPQQTRPWGRKHSVAYRLGGGSSVGRWTVACCRDEHALGLDGGDKQATLEMHVTPLHV